MKPQALYVYLVPTQRMEGGAMILGCKCTTVFSDGSAETEEHDNARVFFEDNPPRTLLERFKQWLNS